MRPPPPYHNSQPTPISEEYRLLAEKHVAADAAANLLEETKSAVLAKLMSSRGDMPVSRAEMQVKASQQWEDFITQMVSAREQAAYLKVKLETIRMRFSEQQSAEANRRAEMKL